MGLTEILATLEGLDLGWLDDDMFGWMIWMSIYDGVGYLWCSDDVIVEGKFWWVVCDKMCL
jgi:hypothetical protein